MSIELYVALPICALAATALLAVAACHYILKRKKFHKAVRGMNVIITGASTGIGEQLAYHFARMGANILITARREQQLQEVVATCRQIAPEGTLHTYIVHDMSRLSTMDQFITDAVNKLGGTLDYLVLNHVARSPLECWEGSEGNFEAFDRSMDVNFKSYVRLSSYARPYLEKQNGHLVVIASVAGKVPIPLSIPYSAEKSALVAFFEGWRTEKIESNISITICILGLIGTDNAIRVIESSNRNAILSKVSPANPTTAAYAIVKGSALRQRGVYYPYFGTKFTVILNDCIPGIIQWVVRKIYNI